jgi:hypothetical protein
VFEDYGDWNLEIGGNIVGPSRNRVNPATAEVVAGDTAFHFYQYISLDFARVRVGVNAQGTDIIAPFVSWNPLMPASIGGKNSRWCASLTWEGNFVRSSASDPNAILQPDNSVYSPRNSLSILVGYWAGDYGNSSGSLEDALRRCPGVDSAVVQRWVRARQGIDWTWSGRGEVDTTDYADFPLDTNSYVRGMSIPEPTVPEESSRQGFSAALGFGSGKYAGSGPLSSFLNIGGQRTDDLQRSGKLFDVGINPMALARYRIGDVIGQLDVAGEDLNFGLIYRGLRQFDVEGGVKYLEHAFPRSTRGPNRSEFFIGVRYAPTFTGRRTSYESGERSTLAFADDSDGDGLPDDVERTITHTDPDSPDTDGDGLSDGVEVLTYRTNPLSADSDGDGISDGAEITSSPHTDPLRADTDGDGLTDGEELQNGTNPLIPSGGERGR